MKHENTVRKLVNNQTFDMIKKAKILSIGEFSSSFKYDEFSYCSGLYFSTIKALILAGTPTIDSRRATWAGKMLMIKHGTSVNREEAEKEGINFFNF